MTASAEPLPAPRTSAFERLSALVSAPEFIAGAVITLLAFVVYWFTGPFDVSSDSYVPLADAFLHGRLSIAVDRPWLELVPVNDGTGAQYSPFPPVPAVVILPFVALTQAMGVGELGSNLMCSVLGAANVAHGVLAARAHRRRVPAAAAADDRLCLHHALVGGRHGRGTPVGAGRGGLLPAR